MTINQHNDLEIYYARYGLDAHNRDVFDCINDEISPNDRLNLLVSNDNLGGDFYPGQPKQLHIIYTFNGVPYEERLDEGELLTIPKQSNISDNALSESVGFGLFVLLKGVSFGIGVVALSWGASRIVKAWRFDT